MLNFLIGAANVLMVVTSLFLICLVLIQRGKGGGLAGAFGGVGGSSAFGTKAGDVFTRVTIYTAGFWFLLALFLVYTSNSSDRTGRGGAFADTTPVSGSPALPEAAPGAAATGEKTAGEVAVPAPPSSSAATPSPSSEPANPPQDILTPGSSQPAPPVGPTPKS